MGKSEFEVWDAFFCTCCRYFNTNNYIYMHVFYWLVYWYPGASYVLFPTRAMFVIWATEIPREASVTFKYNRCTFSALNFKCNKACRQVQIITSQRVEISIPQRNKDRICSIAARIYRLVSKIVRIKDILLHSKLRQTRLPTFKRSHLNEKHLIIFIAKSRWTMTINFRKI